MGRVKNANHDQIERQATGIGPDDLTPDWGGQCDVCGASPVVPLTGLCGPCTFGDADTVGGNW